MSRMISVKATPHHYNPVVDEIRTECSRPSCTPCCQMCILRGSSCSSYKHVNEPSTNHIPRHLLHSLTNHNIHSVPTAVPHIPTPSSSPSPAHRYTCFAVDWCAIWGRCKCSHQGHEFSGSLSVLFICLSLTLSLQQLQTSVFNELPSPWRCQLVSTNIYLVLLIPFRSWKGQNYYSTIIPCTYQPITLHSLGIN